MEQHKIKAGRNGGLKISQDLRLSPGQLSISFIYFFQNNLSHGNNLWRRGVLFRLIYLFLLPPGMSSTCPSPEGRCGASRARGNFQALVRV